MSLRTRRADSRSTSVAAAVAAMSVSVAMWLSLQPHRLVDLFRVAAWASQWLHGAQLYGATTDVDYPPWAIVTLSPLAWLPSGLLPWCWVACNLTALAIVARRLSRSRRLVFYLLIAAGAMRTLNQFTLVSLAFAVVGTTAVTRFSPVWLGLSLIKPQIGGVFWLHAVWTRQWKLAISSLVAPGVLLGVYASRAHVSMWEALHAYAGSIGVQYGEVLWGQTEVTSWLRVLWPYAAPVLVTTAVAVIVFATLARTRPQLGLSLASLLSVRHLSYDLVLLLPWVATLEGRALWIASALLIADPAAILGMVAPGSVGALHADRIAVLAFWAVASVALKPIGRPVE